MTSETTSDNRAVAVATFNRCWDLIDQGQRSADEDAELLTAAFTSRYHWLLEGGDMQAIMADWMVSRAASEVGAHDVAVAYAHRAQQGVEGSEQEPWLRASVLEGLARAYAGAGDGAKRDQYVQQAWAALDEEPDPENKEVIAPQIESVPTVG